MVGSLWGSGQAIRALKRIFGRTATIFLLLLFAHGNCAKRSRSCLPCGHSQCSDRTPARGNADLDRESASTGRSAGARRSRNNDPLSAFERPLANGGAVDRGGPSQSDYWEDISAQ